MKASDRIKKATALEAQIKAILEPINVRLRVLLADDSAHIVYQGGDGWCICHNSQDNSCVSFLDIDELLTMSREEALTALSAAGI